MKTAEDFIIEMENSNVLMSRESTFKEYIKETEISMKPKSELKIAILSEVYMEGKEIKQFLYEHNLGYGRTFYYARNELYEELAVRVFGIYALKL